MSADVTERNSALCNADSAGVPAEREAGPEGLEALHSAITDGDGNPGTTAGWFARFGRFMTPPPMLTEQRPSADQMREYAYTARYTDRLRGWRRRLGIAWCYLVTIPVAFLSRLREWRWEHPGRALAVYLPVKLLSFTPPGVWVADHLVKPTVRFALWLFL